MHLLDRIRRTIREHGLARPDTRVVAALSGGPDSVALVHVLLALEQAGDLRVAGVAHFNHQLRAAAAADEEFCQALADAVTKPLLVDRGDVAARARLEQQSREAAGRTSRHEFLERARQHFAADVIALGHTRDDQAETFLLRLTRGAGARGLAGMHPRRGHVIRPLLDCRRSELRAYLDDAGVRYVLDESNADVSIPRNRVRAELLPFLEQRFNPNVVEVLADEAAIARDEWQWMEGEAERLFARACRGDGQVWRIDAALLAAAPVALARRVVHRVLTEAAGGRAVAFDHVRAALALVRRPGPPVDGPGLRLQRIAGDVVLTGRPAGHKGRLQKAPASNFSQLSLSIPGEVRSQGGWAVSAEAPAGSSAATRAVAGKGPVAAVRLDRLKAPLAVRSRKPGDRFAPIGLIGRKKLQDFFVDLKVARDRRDQVPIVVDAADRIVWVAGYAIDREFAVTDSAQAVVILRLKHLGGPG
jgi:tRNA(Ile)-lysidine synthase